MRRTKLAVAALLLLPSALVAQAATQGHASHAGHAANAAHDSVAGKDSAFAAVQARGKVAMGVDQYTSVHRFDDLSDGGRIELQRDPADTAGVSTIRAHLREIADAFAAGDFATPGFVHDREVPGVRVMAAKKEAIRYRFEPLPGGGAVRIVTADPDALKAIHAFLAFQRSDHRAGGMEH